MEIYSFKEITSKKMRRIKDKYSLIESFHKETIRYRHKDFTLMISLENYFEVSVCFVFDVQKDKIVYLAPLLQYLNFSCDVVEVVHRNQHSEKTLRAYLEKLLPIIDIVISRLLESDNIVFNYLSFDSAHNKLMLKEEQLQEARRMLNQKWFNHDYGGFLELYTEHKHLAEKDSLSQKRAAYAQKREFY